MLEFFSERNQAYLLSRFIYRDTEIEDFHRNKITLDMKLYDVVFRIVDENVKKVIRYHPIMLIALQQPNSSNAELQTLSISEQKEFRYYVSSFYTLSRYTCDWDPPIKLELAGKPENLAQFILDGHFMECCKKRCVLSDATMCYLNKDIYNRIYTLLCEKYLW